MPFCAAAAIVHGHVGVETFEVSQLRDAAILAVQSRVSMHVDPTLDPSAPALTQAHVTVKLRDGRVLTACANGARGYPARPASDAELAAKFTSCASRTLPAPRVARALAMLQDLDRLEDCRLLFA